MATRPMSTGLEHVGLLIEIAHLAHRFASEVVARDIAEDVAQDVVLECLIKVREQTWHADDASIQGLIRNMVRRRAIDSLRRTQRREERNAEHVRDLSDGAHGWMSPDIASDERELAALHAETLASLPGKCRRIYVMVREDRIAYEVVAARLGLSRSAVSWHIVAAQRRFRRRLKDHGIVCRGHIVAALPHGINADRRTWRRKRGL
jgi:RNA polymerase sigma factor (sigma-70 family)